MHTDNMHRLRYLLKIPCEFSEIIISSYFPQWAKVEPRGVRDPCGSARVTSNLGAGRALRGIPPEGDAGRSRCGPGELMGLCLVPLFMGS